MVISVVVMFGLIYTTRKSAASETDLMMIMLKIFISCVHVPAPPVLSRTSFR